MKAMGACARVQYESTMILSCLCDKRPIVWAFCTHEFQKALQWNGYPICCRRVGIFAPKLHHALRPAPCHGASRRRCGQHLICAMHMDSDVVIGVACWMRLLSHPYILINNDNQICVTTSGLALMKSSCWASWRTELFPMHASCMSFFPTTSCNEATARASICVHAR